MAEEDLIFGKKLHLFGGIEPSNMLAISAAAYEGAKVQLTLTLPNDTVLNSQTLCSVGGAVVRRTSTRYPENEFDGDEVVDITASGKFIDSSAKVDGTYYYSVFPYSTQGVYNRSTVNRFAYNEPVAMVAFNSELSYDETAGQNFVKITATLPSGVAGAIIRRSTTGYPTTETDGTELRNVKLSTVFIDNDVIPGQTYYYSAFPYTSTGNVNRSATNRTSIVVVKKSPPGNMQAFSAACTAVGTIRLTATLPANAEGATVSGAIIRRKTGSYPVNETDGTAVTDLKASGTYNDTTVETSNGTIYYYAAFPYTTAGIYNRNQVSANRASAKSLAAVIPDNMRAFSVTATAAKQLTLTYTLPADKYEGGVVVSKVSGVVIRRKTSGYPTSETDGDLVTNATASGTFVDNNLTANQTYYYTAFPYSDRNLYNRNQVAANRASTKVKAYNYLFGYDIVLDDSNPATRVSYPSDVDNADFAPVSIVSSNIHPGDWNLSAGMNFMPKPCMLKFNGEVAYYLNPENYAYRDDGVTASDIANESYDGVPMVEWPKIYTKRWVSSNVYHFRCSDAKLDGDYECWCNYDVDNNETDHFYTSIYWINVNADSEGICRAVSGKTAKTVLGNSYTSYLQTINSVDKGWYYGLLSDRLLINDLLTLLAKSTNIQLHFGRGRTTYSLPTSGVLDALGMFSFRTVGDAADGTDDSYVKAFGIENLWCYDGELTNGLSIVGSTSTPYMGYKITLGTKDGTSSIMPTNLTTTGFINSYKSLSFSSRQYIWECLNTAYGRIPIPSSNNIGSSSTYECDSYYRNSSQGLGSCGCTSGTDSSGDYIGPFAIKWQSKTSGLTAIVRYSYRRNKG